MLIRFDDLHGIVVDLQQCEESLLFEMHHQSDGWPPSCGVVYFNDNLPVAFHDADDFTARYFIRPEIRTDADQSYKHSYIVTYLRVIKDVQYMAQAVFSLTEHGPMRDPSGENVVMARKWTLESDVFGVKVIMPKSFNVMTEIMEA